MTGPRLELPVLANFGDQHATLRLAESGDAHEIVAFARRLPDHDLLHLRRDIRQAEVVAGWLREVAEGRMTSVLAISGGQVVGYVTLDRTQPEWMAHVAEMHIAVETGRRESGLGSLLVRFALALAGELGVEKTIAQMTPDQTSAIALCRHVGFREEARLRAHVQDLDGVRHDLIVMARTVSDVQEELARVSWRDALAAAFHFGPTV